MIGAFACLFTGRGLPAAMRRDNGLPFASPNGLYNLSRLPVRWLRSGIAIARTRPGNPQENGTHERMHRPLLQETRWARCMGHGAAAVGLGCACGSLAKRGAEPYVSSQGDEE